MKKLYLLFGFLRFSLRNLTPNLFIVHEHLYIIIGDKNETHDSTSDLMICMVLLYLSF